ncbi:molybdopterin biosynthesis enzyme [Macroventuria anomochaeta]|uniref:Molybdopterin biosynthesis enzyme n=1 Tax=Macroventuria anomochaeta TaxID=301207 RepID=A0ACB6RNZ0_9PLEO|nr:molybdopterin biosynthesis enzyme [Macroventuria anomochaeta]KAF2623022.1 molybdopterin biosynthesis enzyme [Macroventuria anomochaeta]
MGISYRDALALLQHTAAGILKDRGPPTEKLPVDKALGRVAAEHHASPICTPPKDTSAMDGYAISSGATVDATVEMPVTFVVQGTNAAGDDPIELPNEPIDGCYPCVEIMTGAQFPISTSNTPFDACVKIEDTVPFGAKSEFQSRHRFVLTRPVRLHANRRFAGGDMQKGDVIVRKGEVVRSRHVMGLASVGVPEVVVRRRLRVAVWTTGNELTRDTDGVRKSSQIFDSNGLFLAAALREAGVDVDLKGILQDDVQSLEEALDSAEAATWDLIITTGAVSKGKFDFIVPALERLRAQVHFHGVAIRPGHPMLFATMDRDCGPVPFFGLPGNPIATAACFRFLVVPFLRQSLDQNPEQPELAELSTKNGGRDMFLASPSHLDCFRHGTVLTGPDGNKMIELSQNQSPAVISQYATSNCWAHIARGCTGESGPIMVQCYPHTPLID